MPWVVFRFLRHGMDGAGCVFAGLGGWRQRVVVLVFIGPLIPCPLGRGNMCGLRASAPPAVRGSGVSSRFPISRGSSSCNLAARCHRLSLLASPFCSRRLVIASALPLASVPAPVFSCCLLSFPSPFLRLAGRGVLCLLAYVLWLSFLSPCSPSVSCPPHAFACLPPEVVLSLSVPLGVSLIVSCGYSVPPIVLFMSYRPLCSFVCPPRLATSVGGECGGSFLLACPIVLVVRASAGVGWIASAG